MNFSDAKSVQQSLPGMFADNQINPLKKTVESAGAENDSEKLKSLSKQFESIMTHQLLSAMRSTVPKSELTGGFSSEIYQSMMDQEVANQVSKGKGLGLADMIFRQVSRLDQKAKASLPTNSNLSSPTTPPTITKPSGEAGSNAVGFPLKRSDLNNLSPISSNPSGMTGSMMKAVKTYGKNP